MKKLFVAALLLFSLLFSLPAAAAEDAFTQLTHNGQACLVVGTIDRKDRTGMLIAPAAFIKSSADLAQGSYEQIEPETIIVKEISYSNTAEEPKRGDSVLLSLVRDSGDRYLIQWGAYRVDSTDPAALAIPAEEGEGLTDAAHLAALQYFVNQGGAVTEFTFDGAAGLVTATAADGSEIQVYSGSPFTVEEEPAVPESTAAQPTPEEEGADMVTAALVACAAVAAFLYVKNRVNKQPF